ncbi:3-hydroxyacyl-[acyl-carrier-protein] dehydratase FabZ [Planctomycetes bacterium Pan216]|uniref:3-hydroxyacyl-[acyl-carrier-protein] dehydratase FabZ n=1 Tax=Kolteria novifilia TaxID=2527975 RepID=A0A518B703_9BACT|nr:3-hydroxyacyl-[acyl-carrier-protein] dehydratase FabZ [Planctomycetes bacterium Pan216]
MPPKAFVEPSEFPEEVIADQAQIRELNPHRFEMEMLTAITLLEQERQLTIGYKDVTDEEFWVRGHMPEFPLMPGVLMIEASAQLSSFYSHYFNIVPKDSVIGFGGINEARFRGMVRPGDRLWIVCKADKVTPRRFTFDAQGFVDGSMVFNGQFIGVSLPAVTRS